MQYEEMTRDDVASPGATCLVEDNLISFSSPFLHLCISAGTVWKTVCNCENRWL